MDYEKVVDEKLPSNSKKIKMIMALMGSTTQFAAFIHNNFDYGKLPCEVLFSLSLAMQNVLAFTSQDACVIPDEDLNYIFFEQTQENYYRLAKEIVGKLSERLKNDEVIL